jgi:hypothetical protein
VHPEHLVGTLRRGAEDRDRDRRRVRREHALGSGEAVERVEQRLLGVDVFADGFDDVVGLAEDIERGTGMEPAQDGITIGGCQFAFLHEPGEAGLDRAAPAVDHRPCDVHQPHLEAGLRERLGNPVAHRPRPHHADSLDRHRLTAEHAE